MIGDILYFRPDNIVPADGIFINKYGIKYNEPSVTSESD
jgi:magnesium-transporting ATPase (P-type)